MIHFLLTLLVILYVVQCEELQKALNSRPKYMSELYSDYFNTEDRLWNRIQYETQSNNDTIYDIINSHRNVFFDDTFESNSYWRSYLLFGIEHLRDHLSNINNTLEENYGYLFDAADKIIFDVSQIEVWTRDTNIRQLRDSSNSLFDITIGRKDVVMQHIHTVSAPINKHFLIFSNICMSHFIGSQMLYTIRKLCYIRSATGSRILCECWKSIAT